METSSRHRAVTSSVSLLVLLLSGCLWIRVTDISLWQHPVRDEAPGCFLCLFLSLGAARFGISSGANFSSSRRFDAVLVVRQCLDKRRSHYLPIILLLFLKSILSWMTNTTSTNRSHSSLIISTESGLTRCWWMNTEKQGDSDNISDLGLSGSAGR